MKKEEGKVVNINGVKGTVKEATPADEKKAKEQERISKQQIAMLQKRAALELADYKKRLNESVYLKRLQVEELQLNIDYFKLKKEYAAIEEEIKEMELKEIAELQAKEEAEKLKAVEVVKVGKPRTEEEIAEGNKEIK